MAHKIENGQIAYSGLTPWHGLGERVLPGTSPEDMLKAAKLDWPVQLRSLAVSSTLQDGKQVWAAAPVQNFKAVVGGYNGEVFAVPTKRYQPVQNIEIARFFADFCDASSCELQVLGALENGRKVWALAKVSADYQICVGDEQLGYVMLATSHDGSLRTVAMGTSVYVVCWNTMSSALSRVGSNFRVGKTNKDKALFSLKHTAKFDNAAKREAAQVVSLVKEQQQQTAEMAELFSKIRLDGQGRIEFVRRLLGGEQVIEQIIADQAPDSLLDSVIAETEKQQAAKAGKLPEETRVGKALIDSILFSPGADLESRENTLWGAINGVTHWVDHQRGRTQDSTLSGAWFGQGAAMKQAAVQVAYDMAGTGGRA
jgi:phage/plasmid-like protein (TIGR03299 family)